MENVDFWRRAIDSYVRCGLAVPAVGMRIWFGNVVGGEVATFDEVLGNESIAALSLMVEMKSRFVEASFVKGPGY